MKSLSETEVLTIYHLSGIGKNPHHTTSAVVNKKATTAKKLEEKYGFSKIQREKILCKTEKRMLGQKISVIEKVTCKMMAMDKGGKSKNHVDTVFDSQKYFFTSNGTKIYIEDVHSNKSVLKSSTFYCTHE
jgi:hypothetical protein